jgi:2-dehydropantoate 2-reductase
LKASPALDLDFGNRRWLGGKVVELGRELGVPTPTPTHSMIAQALHHGCACLSRPMRSA